MEHVMDSCPLLSAHPDPSYLLINSCEQQELALEVCIYIPALSMPTMLLIVVNMPFLSIVLVWHGWYATIRLMPLQPIHNDSVLT